MKKHKAHKISWRMEDACFFCQERKFCVTIALCRHSVVVSLVWKKLPLQKWICYYTLHDGSVSILLAWPVFGLDLGDVVFMLP